MKKILFILILFVSTAALSQEKLSSEKGVIHFEASIPFFEEVKAKNDAAICTLKTKANDFSCIVSIKNFRFKIGLMEEHFNRNYMESDHYPKARFKGKIEKLNWKDINEIAKEYQIRGKLEIHGKSKKIMVLAKIKKMGKGIQLISNFNVNTDDYDIQIPSMVRSKIAKNVSIQIECVLQ